MIEARHLTKYYGARPAVRDLSFTIEPGQVVGFLGLNGAGKTTTLRLLCGDLAPSSGSVRIQGTDLDANPREVRRRIGFLPDQPPLYPEMGVREYLRYAGALRGLSGRRLTERVAAVAETVGLGDVLGDLVGDLSHGYRQRLGIGQAIVHGPELVILDEPISGLDPVQITEMRELIRALKGQHTVLLSSHILTEISQTCDRILVMGAGGILADGSEAELLARLTTDLVVRVVVRGRREAVEPLLAALPGVRSVGEPPRGVRAPEPDTLTLDVHTDTDVRADIARALVGAGVGLVALGRVERELESLFVALTRAGSAGPSAREASSPRRSASA